jgi:glycosyltransferase involved in cell wall biosynthesis
MENKSEAKVAPLSRRIIHTEASHGWGGQEIRILAEMEAFRERGYTMEVACHPDSLIAARAREKQFTVWDFPFDSPGNLLTVIRFIRLLQRQDWDLVHTHSSVDAWIGGIAAKLVGKPLVRSRHLSSVIKRKPTNSLAYRGLPDAVIASGRHIAEHVIERSGAESEKVFSVPAGADEDRFRPDPEAREQVRRELGISEQAPVIGMVAVLRSWKGHLKILEALPPVLETIPELRVLFVGEGPIRSILEEQICERRLGNVVTLVGHRMDVERYFPALDVHVLASIKNEATSQVVPQAMLCGVANIVSDAGGLTEVIESEKSGIVVPAGSTASLTKAILTLLKDKAKREQLAESGRKVALSRFTFKQQIDATEAVYDKVLQSAARE